MLVLVAGFASCGVSGIRGAKATQPLICTHFDPEKVTLLVWAEIPDFQIGATSPNTPLMVHLFEGSRKNGTQTATARHKGKKNLFNCCWSGRIPFRAKMCYSPEYSSFIWESVDFTMFWALKVGQW